MGTLNEAHTFYYNDYHIGNPKYEDRISFKFNIPNFMFNMDTHPVNACWDCSKAVAQAHRLFFASLK